MRGWEKELPLVTQGSDHSQTVTREPPTLRL